MKDGKHKKQRSQVNLKQQPPVKVKRPTGCTPGQWTIKTGPGLSLTNSSCSPWYHSAKSFSTTLLTCWSLSPHRTVQCSIISCVHERLYKSWYTVLMSWASAMSAADSSITISLLHLCPQNTSICHFIVLQECSRMMGGFIRFLWISLSFALLHLGWIQTTSLLPVKHIVL